ncbi:MAG: CAP domain-containing protein [Treponema sp.]|jgi:uncharacterized protein YkwD|nr:CAP domain-containing protein [Treponema sp.]
MVKKGTAFVSGLVFFGVMSIAAQAKDWDISLLDTARNVTYLTRTEKDVILALNKARSNPQRYMEEYIAPRTAWFKGNLYQAPGQDIPIRTSEGVSAVNECVRVLRAASPTGILYPREGLSLGARDHVWDQGRTNQTGHYGRDGSDPSKRVNRYGTGGCGENIAYGTYTGEEIVAQLFIDDGVPGRGHRTNNLSPDYRYVGAAIGPHKGYGIMCVIDFSERYVTAGNAAEAAEAEAFKTALLSKRLAQDWAGWEALDGAANADYLSGFEKDLLLELNKARSNPYRYAEQYMTGQDAAAVKSSRAAAPFLLARGLCLSAADHSGSMSDRLSRYGEWSGSAGEAVINGSFPNAREAVIYLLEKQRNYALGSSYKVIGFAVSDSDYGMQIRFEFANTYTHKRD